MIENDVASGATSATPQALPGDASVTSRSQRRARKRSLASFLTVGSDRDTRDRVVGGARRARDAARVTHTTLDRISLSRRSAIGAGALAATAGVFAATKLPAAQSVVSGSALREAAAGIPPESAQLAVGQVSSGSGARKGTAKRAATVAAPAALTLPSDLSVEHLLKRVTFGPTPTLRNQVDKLGAGAWLARQLAPASIADPLGAKVDAMYPRMNWSIDKVRAMEGQNDSYYEFLYEPSLVHTGKALWSSRQLYEIMVEFWSDHLHVPAPADKGSWARHRYDADVIRAHALGRFDEMLVASSVHPAMVAYLDSDKSTPRQPNENYARELMELHTLGVNGGYTEKDVKQAALLLTGWETPWPSQKTRWMSSLHYSKPVTVLGRRIGNGSGATGRKAQQNFVRSLAQHPSTARHICRKLAIRFVSDTPSTELVDALAKTYLAKNTAIVPVLTQLFASEEFAAAENAKLRRPFERVVATLRSLGITFTGNRDGLLQLYWTLSTLGHNPYDWPTPDGFPDVSSAWQSPATALEMINSTSGMVHNWWEGKLGLPGPAKWLPKTPTTRAAAIDGVAQQLFGRPPTAAEKSAANTLLASTRLNRSFRNSGWDREETVALTALIMFNSPDFLTR